jgi:hypothetical protein
MCGITVLGRKKFSMSMSFVVINVCMCGREWEKKEAVGDRQGLKMGQLTLSRGPARVEVGFFVQRATIPSKRV